MSGTAELDAPAPTARDTRPATRRGGGGRLRTVARGASQTMITAGLVILLFVVHQLWITDLMADRAQDRLTEQIQDQWADAPTVVPPADADPAPGTRPSSA